MAEDNFVFDSNHDNLEQDNSASPLSDEPSFEANFMGRHNSGKKRVSIANEGSAKKRFNNTPSFN